MLRFLLVFIIVLLVMPLAVVLLLLWPLLWVILLPFRLMGIVAESALALIRAVLMLPARILGGGRPRP
jgi:hypothetical protein